MDSSPQAVANELGTSRATIVRAARRLSVGRRTPGGQWRFTRADVAKLRTTLGAVTRAPGLSRLELRILASLQRAPRGALSARAVARAVGTSPTATSHALDILERNGHVQRRLVTVAEGTARRVSVWQINYASPAWPDLAPLLASVEPPRRTIAARADKLPRRFAHLFWNVGVDDLDVARDSILIAQRIVRSDDLDALAWAAHNLPAVAWRTVAAQRGLDPRRRSLALNLANHADAA